MRNGHAGKPLVCSQWWHVLPVLQVDYSGTARIHRYRPTGTPSTRAQAYNQWLVQQLSSLHSTPRKLTLGGIAGCVVLLLWGSRAFDGATILATAEPTPRRMGVDA